MSKNAFPQRGPKNDNEEEVSDVLIDSMVNSDEYSAVDLANVIMNHCSPNVLLEALKRNITKITNRLHKLQNVSIETEKSCEEEDFITNLKTRLMCEQKENMQLKLKVEALESELEKTINEKNKMNLASNELVRKLKKQIKEL